MSGVLYRGSCTHGVAPPPLGDCAECARIAGRGGITINSIGPVSGEPAGGGGRNGNAHPLEPTPAANQQEARHG